MSGGQAGADVRVERHAAGYDYRARFPRVREVLGAEGGAVYAADGPEGAELVKDESEFADLLPEEDSTGLVTVRMFATSAARDAHAAELAGRAGPGPRAPGA